MDHHLLTAGVAMLLALGLACTPAGPTTPSISTPTPTPTSTSTVTATLASTTTAPASSPTATPLHTPEPTATRIPTSTPSPTATQTATVEPCRASYTTPIVQGALGARAARGRRQGLSFTYGRPYQCIRPSTGHEAERLRSQRRWRTDLDKTPSGVPV